MIENKAYLMNTYSQQELVLTKGEGMYLIDAEGKKYLDFVAGIAVNCLGYSFEPLKKALKEQVEELLHCSNLYYNDEQLRTVKKLCEKTGMDKAFFCNSGAEATEAAMKLARKYSKYKGYEDRSNIITMKNSFHGRTFGAITATGQTKYQKGLDPLLPGISYVEYNNIEELKAAVNEKTCAVMLEVIQGEGGIVSASKEFLEAARSLCDEKDMVLIYDEVQTGVGRTGYPMAYMKDGVKPDICAMAKGLGAGIPVGAMVCTQRVSVGFMPGDHASTFGGNPMSMAAANVVLDYALSEEMMEHVREMGSYLRTQLEQLKEEFTVITDLRGIGLMQGIALSYPPAQLTKKALEKGLLLVGAGADVVRFVPPFIVEKEQIDQMISILREVL